MFADAGFCLLTILQLFTSVVVQMLLLRRQDNVFCSADASSSALHCPETTGCFCSSLSLFRFFFGSSLFIVICLSTHTTVVFSSLFIEDQLSFLSLLLLVSFFVVFPGVVFVLSPQPSSKGGTRDTMDLSAEHSVYVTGILLDHQS